MDYRVDDKGKYFTKHVNKPTVPVIARVGDLIVQGIVHLTPDNRLKDELNNEETFIAITDAQVKAVNGERVLYETNVLIVNKTQIIWIFPHETGSPRPAGST